MGKFLFVSNAYTDCGDANIRITESKHCGVLFSVSTFHELTCCLLFEALEIISLSSKFLFDCSFKLLFNAMQPLYNTGPLLSKHLACSWNLIHSRQFPSSGFGLEAILFPTLKKSNGLISIINIIPTPDFFLERALGALKCSI